MKRLLFVLAISFAFSTSYAQEGHLQSTAEDAAAPASKEVVLKGKLIRKPWTKSTESYCAQGSDYFVLLVDGREHILDIRKSTLKKLQRTKRKKVTVRGQFITRFIPGPSEDEVDHNLQHPVSSNPETGEVSGDVTCTVFKVRGIGKK